MLSRKLANSVVFIPCTSKQNYTGVNGRTFGRVFDFLVEFGSVFCCIWFVYWQRAVGSVLCGSVFQHKALNPRFVYSVSLVWKLVEAFLLILADFSSDHCVAMKDPVKSEGLSQMFSACYCQLFSALLSNAWQPLAMSHIAAYRCAASMEF